MNKLIANILNLITVVVIWVITADYLSSPNSTMISFILCLFSIIIPLRFVSNCRITQKMGTNFPSFWRNPE